MQGIVGCCQGLLAPRAVGLGARSPVGAGLAGASTVTCRTAGGSQGKPGVPV